MFVWPQGRVLNALQLVMISEGSGELEWRSSVHRISAGDAFVLLPGQWHRYRPDLQTGWTEDWFELRGGTVDTWLNTGVIGGKIANVNQVPEFALTFLEMHELCSQAAPRGRAVAAGLAMSLLARFTLLGSTESDFSGVPARMQIAQRRLMEGARVVEVALELGLGYLTFYRQFKRAMGIAPQEFAGQVRLARAENFLVSTTFSIKHIAARLGYHSAGHFSQEFKKARGKTPTQWRQEYRRECQVIPKC